MKTLVNSLLAAAVFTIASTAFCQAQTRTIEHDFSEFDGIAASNSFKVSIGSTENLESAGGYSVKITVDDALESYVQCYVKSKTLYIGLDEKSIPKEVKKQYSAKNAPSPVLNAVVYMPTLNSITLSDDAVFTPSGTLDSKDFSLTLSDNTSLSNLNVTAKSASVKVSKKAKLSSINIKADDISVNAEGSGNIILEYASKNLTVDNSGSAQLTLNGSSDKVTVTTSNSAKATISGKASSIKAQGKGGSSVIDASSLSVLDASVAIDGASVMVNPENTLRLDLGKGATVKYTSDPVVTIVSIQNASVTRK